MESRDRAPQALTPSTRSAQTLAWRFRLLAVSLGLFALAFVQAPGRVLTDTKLDLVVDPAGFLGRALTMWDPIGAFGQVQNQAYGYLFPMGPFFLLGDLVQIEPWIVQRLWWSLLLVTAFLGIVKLCAAMQIGAPWARIVAGLAYALSPRILSVIGPSSIEVWPMALAPWVLVPLVLGLRRADPRRMAALSALAVACVGGVNAVATFAVIPLGALWLLLAPGGPRRRAMMIWWPVFVLMGTLWWLVPLFVLGQYSPPFLDYIESASTTTFAATVFDALRGTSNWVPYVDTDSLAGNELVRSIGLIANGAVVVALGLVGLARRGTPYRRFLVSGLLLGLVLVTLGHTGTVDGWGSATFQSVLDGVLSPLRNTHKFDLLIRIPLVLGFAHLISGLATAAARNRESDRAMRLGVAVLGVVAVLGATVPAWTGQIANRGTYESVPGYWEEAADWLAEQDSDQRALVVPAASFGDYLWGSTGDDVLQPLARTPWATRNAIPLVPGGNIRTLDAIERKLASGEGSAGFLRYLKRAGVRHLVVRNDLGFGTEHTDTTRVYSTLASTPEITLAAQFGPTLGSKPLVTGEDGGPVWVAGGWQAERAAVEIFNVGEDDAGPVTVQDADSTAVVAGGPASLLTLDEIGDGLGAAVLADDVASGEVPERVVLTDGARRQEAAFGRAEQNRSASLTADEPFTLDRPVHDYRVSPEEEHVSVRRLEGAQSITASSSQSDANAPGALVPGQHPWSAFDGDPLTAWKAGAGDTGTSWIEMRLSGRTDIPRVRLTLDSSAERQRTVTVHTDAGTVEAGLQPGVSVDVSLPEGATRRLRISSGASAFDPLTLSEVEVPGLQLSRPLVMPRLAESWGAPEQIVMAVDQADRSGCLVVKGATRCVEGQQRWGEDGRTLDRELTLNEAATYEPSLTVEPAGGAGLDALVQAGRLAGASVSSYAVEDARNSAAQTIDGDPATGWIAAAEDLDPTLTLRWVGERRLSRLRVETSRRLAASVPQEATLRFSDGTSQDVTFRDGLARFTPVATEFIEIHFGRTDVRSSADAFGLTEPLPVGVSEAELPGRFQLYPQRPRDDAPIGKCGSGPTVEVDGKRIPTRVTATAAEILEGGPVSATLCGVRTVDLAEGNHRIRVVGNDAFRPTSLVLGSLGTTTQASPATASSWGKTERSVSLDGADSDGDRLVTVAENTNAGWRARDGYQSVQVNGWQQGWVVPAGTGDLSLEFGPSGAYRAGLLAGAVAFLGLLVSVLLMRRRRSSLPPERGRRQVWALPVLVATGVVVGLLAGTTGVLVALGGLVVGLGIRRFSPEILAWATGLPVAVAAAGYVVRPWGSGDGWAGEWGWPQLLVVCSLGLLASSVVAGGVVGRRPRLRRRSEGTSTAR
ncbi:alpha-(1-_3)-arabinofuranosyltransferase [Mumia sp. zg.B21]|uniref:alpha-(1->3)-arabinofuranosyltransferase n=1 Tax=Mumia sp. zg.B21 TaxID=2855447 RepID=UPI001C6EE0F6|nr:alpha-(1->3)-arabinofuranosyltransferase [Mumia sp. zg.B21]MBW9211527.1 alpha-(1->3)-arabinofuranosyltransferase [Mumia sp. zg.B21]